MNGTKLKDLSGVIIPPPEIKKTIESAAELVTKYGGSIEIKLRAENQHLPKFFFLNSNDPYHSYYNYVKERLLKKKEEEKINLENSKNIENMNLENKKEDYKKLNFQEELRKIITESKFNKGIDIKQPSPDIYSVIHPSISPLEL